MCEPMRGAAAGCVERKKHSGGDVMAWTTPIIIEICAGFEFTAYAPAEM
jgi:coenzyme PQQ precursor peptide PqqA